MKILCPAKINLFLNVLGKIGSMHDLVLLNQTVSLYDEIELIVKDDSLIVIESEDPIPLDETNSIYKAAKLFKDTYGITDGLFFRVKKKIPVEAGLGGESTDAAGTLLLLNECYHLNISKEELSKLGIQIGSDVPFFIHSGFQMVTSIGDQVQECSFDNPFTYYVIVKPNFGLSTKEMFQQIDFTPFEKRDMLELPYNDFMKVVPNSILDIQDYFNTLLLDHHTLSGSGSSYYAALKKKDEELYLKVKEHYPEYQVFLLENCDGFQILEK